MREVEKLVALFGEVLMLNTEPVADANTPMLLIELFMLDAKLDAITDAVSPELTEQVAVSCPTGVVLVREASYAVIERFSLALAVPLI